MNHRRTTHLQTVFASLTALMLVAGCGSSQPATPPSTSPNQANDATSSEPRAVSPTDAQLTSAHFRSADGMHGLTLDRSGAKPKIQIDGANEIIELTQHESRKHGTLEGYELISPDGRRMILISTYGGVTYFKGRDTFHMNADRKAPPLGTPTVTGTYVPPPPAHDAISKKFQAISVRTKLPQFKPEDSANLAKVAEVFQLATADMFVRYASRGSKSGATFDISSLDGVSFGGVRYESDERWDPKAKGLARLGGKVGAFSEYGSGGNHLQVMTLQGYPPPLADGTPGIVWETNGAYVVFVSLDGGRYNLELTGTNEGATLEQGAGPTSAWPNDIQHPFMTLEMVTALAKSGAAPQKAGDDLLKIDNEWNECAQSAWKGAQKQIDSHRWTEADRKDWDAKVVRTCKKHVDAFEKDILAFAEARAQERRNLFEKGKAQVTKLGANK